MAIQLANYQATLSWDASEYKKGMKEAESSFNSFSSKMGSIGKGIVNGIGIAITAATTAIVAFGKSAVDAGMNFDAAVSQLAATMGTTTDQIQSLREKAQELGASTSFSATQAAEGLNVLAMSGLSAEEQISAIDTVLNLAAAGAIEMADAASYTIGAVKGFGDNCDNAQYYADLMAKGATLAATDVRGLGEALSGSAATAASYGQTADSVTLSLLRLAEQNVTGSAAATALNRAMADLYIPTDAASGALADLGISAYDAEGKARDFNDVVDELNVALSGMTEEEANAYKGAIFTAQGLKAFNMMTVSSTEKVNEFKEGLASASDGIGSAAQQAETMLDNLQGDVTIFKSAVEGLQIGVSDTLTGLLRDTVQFGTEQITLLTDAVKEGGLTGLAGAVGEILVNIVNKITEYIPQLLNLGIEMVKSLLNGISNSAGDIANTAASIVTTLIQGIFELLPQVVNVAITVVTTFIQSIAEQLPTLIPVIVDGILQAVQAIIDNLPTLLNAVISVIEGLADGIINAIPILLETLPQIIESLINAIVNFQSRFTETAGKIITAIVNALPGFIQSIVSIIPSLIETIINSIKTLVPQFVNAVISIIQAIADALPDIIQSIIAILPSLIETIIGGLLDLIPTLIDAVLQLVLAIVEALPDIIINIVNALPDLLGTILDALIALVPDLINCVLQLVLAIVEALPDIIMNIINALPDIIDSIVDALLGMVDKIIDCGVKLLVALIEDLPTIITEIVKAIPQIISGLVKAIIESIPKIIEAGVKLLMGLITNLPQIIIELVKAMPQIITALVNALGEGISQFAEIGANLVRGLWDGIQSLAGWIWDKVSSWASDLWNGILDFFGIASPSRQMAWVGEMLMEGLSSGITDNGDDAIDASQEIAENVLNAFEDMADDISDIENGAFNTDINKGVTLSATYDKSNLPKSISANLDTDSSYIIVGLNSVFDSFINRADSLIDRLIRSFDVGNANGISTANKTITLNVGNNTYTISGIMDKTAAEQVKAIAEGQVQEFSYALADVLDVMYS